MRRFEDYKREVILAYEKKKKEKTLPYYLETPTYVNLRKECLDVFESRYTEKDNSIFKDLFQKKRSKKEYYQLLEETEATFFRPLYDFLRGRSNNTNDRYIELLAWLIDFEPRPHKPYSGYDLPEDAPPPPKDQPDEKPEPDPITDPIPEPENPAPEEPESTTEKQELTIANSTDQPAPIDPVNDKGIFGIPRKFYRTISMCLLAFLAISSAFFIWEIFLRPKCMFWDGDRYQYTDCDENLGYGTIILKVDPHIYAHQKRITNPSQIRLSDVGKVYYSKMNNEVTFYKIKGDNPVDTARRLLPMSPTIFWKYASGKDQ